MNDNSGDFISKILNPFIEIEALAKTIKLYVDGVLAKEIEYPAHRRKDDSIVQMWNDIRLETLYHLFNFGDSNPTFLCDPFKQLPVWRRFIDDKPRLSFPQPNGDQLDHTIQSVWQVYLYLDRIGTEVGDRETDKFELKFKDKHITSHLEEEAVNLKASWEVYKGKTLHTPITFYKLIYEDVTFKTKSIALSAKLGPYYEKTIKKTEELFAERGEDPTKISELLNRILNAKDPDEFNF